MCAAGFINMEQPFTDSVLHIPLCTIIDMAKYMGIGVSYTIAIDEV